MSRPCHMFAVTCALITCSLFAVRCSLSLIPCHPSPVTCHPSPVTRHLSPVTRHPSPVTRHPSPVTRHLSNVTRHPSLSPFLCPLLPVTCHLFMLKDFLETRLKKWKRLEELTSRASRLRLRSLSGEEVREFGQLYRRTAADLAIAREEVRDQRLVNYLNHLVGRAHGAIYRSGSSGFGVFITFFRYEFPAVFRKTFAYTLTAFLIFIAAAVFAAAACLIDEGFADRVAPQLRQDIAAHNNWTERVNKSNPLASTSIQTNNITVTFYAFGGGVLAGIGTLLVLAQNGLLLGMVLSLCFRYRFWEIP